MTSKHIPYRGEMRPKLRGHPSPPDPNEKLYSRIFWFILTVIGIGSGYFVLTKPTNENIVTFLGSLMFFVIALFAAKDLKKIKMITPDLDEQNKVEDNKDRPSLAQDYFKQLEWRDTRHPGRFWSRQNLFEPEWRYQPATPQRNTSGVGCSSSLAILIIPFLALFGIMYIALTFGVNSPITIGILIVFGVIAVSVWLIVQEIKDGPNIILRKYRMKELGHKTSKHSKK